MPVLSPENTSVTENQQDASPLDQPNSEAAGIPSKSQIIVSQLQTLSGLKPLLLSRFDTLFKPVKAQAPGKIHASVVVKPKSKKRKKRPLPPGQRLIRAMAVALALVGGQEVLQPLLGPCESTAHGATHAVAIAPPFTMSSELADAKQQVDDACKVKRLTPGIFAIDPKTGAYIDFNGGRQFPAASMIKVPVLVALFTAIDHGDVDAKTILTIRQDLVGGGSGHLQYRPVGTKLPLSTVSELMIIISDNTATNMIIDLVGGKEVVNKKFTAWGLKNTSISNWLPDLTGTNKTSPHDLVYLLARVDRGEILSPASRARMFEIMTHTKTRTLINPALPPGVKLSHKTGDIGSMVGDTGVITSINGSKIYMAVQCERPHNDRRANELVRKLAAIAWNGFVHEPGFDEAKPELAKNQPVEVLKVGAHASNVGGRVKGVGTEMLKTEPRVPSESYSEAVEQPRPQH
jgi:beta-lactamase class A